jgi:uncharacterized protein YcbK (DUF882 family)
MRIGRQFEEDVMSSLLVERVHVVTAGLAVAVAYLVSPVAASATTCDIMPKSFDCMAGINKNAEAVKADAPKAVKVASIAPAAVANDADQGASEAVVEPRPTSRKAAGQGRNGKASRSASGRRSRDQRSAASQDNVTRKGWRTRNGGFQSRGGVVTGCFPGRLRSLLSQVASHYGRSLVITSGYRSPSHNRRIGGARESQHLHCTAADFFIPGVSPFTLASYLKAMAGRGGVGTYCGNRTVHLDVGPRREWHWGCGRSHYAGRRTTRRHYASARFRHSRG